MPIENYLLDGEKILAKAGIFYATNIRLIRYEKNLYSEQLDDIPYSHITSIGVVKSTRRGLIKAGIVLIVTGISTLLTMIVMSSILKTISDILSTLPGTGFDLTSLFAPLTPFSLVITFIGLVILIVGIFMPLRFIQFRAPGLNKDAEAKFRLSSVHNELSQNLLRVIRQQSLGMTKTEITSVQSQENRGDKTPDK